MRLVAPRLDLSNTLIQEGGSFIPLYIYVCQKCNKIFELLIKLADYNDVVICPDCGKVMTKLITPVMFKT